MFVHYFVRLRTNHYTLLTISPISFIFDSARNLTRNFPYPLFDVLWKYRLSGENGEMRDKKNDCWDGLRNAIYTLIISHISPTFFHVLVNLTISVQLAKEEIGKVFLNILKFFLFSYFKIKCLFFSEFSTVEDGIGLKCLFMAHTTLPCSLPIKCHISRFDASKMP